MTTRTRQTAEERRVELILAARAEFAQKGYHGASTEAIAKAAGISHPYLFRLFGSKKALYLTTCRETVDMLYERFRKAARGKTGEDALHAMGEAFNEAMQDRDHLMLMLKSWASCDDPDICALVRESWRRLTELAELTSGESAEVVTRFFSSGALLTVLMSMNALEQPEPWSERLVAGCRAAME